MRPQRVERVVDMLAGPQGRIVLWLACGHKQSLTYQQVAAIPRSDMAALMRPDAQVMCGFCPDVPPQEARREKSATQLWREAGEP